MKQVPTVNIPHFSCLSCGDHLFRVDHLCTPLRTRDVNAGGWYCDRCGVAHNVRIDVYNNIYAEIDEKAGKCLPTSVVLKIPPQADPIYFLMEGMRFTKEDPDPGYTQEEYNQSRDRYFYEEHSCPTNWLPRVVEIVICADTDPHGLWEHIGTIEKPPRDDSNNPELPDLLKQLGET